MEDLQGKALAVFGGSSGIGWAIAARAAGLGAFVTVADPASPPGGEEQIDHAPCDATNPVAVRDVLSQVVDRKGRLDGVVTCVGGGHLGEIDEMSLDDWDAEVRFNLTSAFVTCQAALRIMRGQGAGSLVTTSSSYGVLPGPDRVAYAAAKAGVIGFTRSLAVAAAPNGVRANCIAPGPTDTPRFRAMNGGDAGVEELRRSMLLGFVPEPSDCAEVAAFLLSDASRSITGQVIHVNGGTYMP